MPWPTWEQLIGLLATLGGGFGYFLRRRDRASEREKKLKDLEAENARLTEQLATAQVEAEKTRRAHEEALAAKNAEIAEWRRQGERKDDRITELEDRLYTGRGHQ